MDEILMRAAYAVNVAAGGVPVYDTGLSVDSRRVG